MSTKGKNSMDLGKHSIAVVCILLTIHLDCSLSSIPSPLRCDFYSEEDCQTKKPHNPKCTLGATCDPAADRRAHCMSEWRNVSGVVTVLRKGCWAESKECFGKPVCEERRTNPDTYSCCCDGDRCNENPLYNPTGLAQDGETPHRNASLRCEYYNGQECEKNKDPAVCNKVFQNCEKPEEGKRSHCYAFWFNVSGEVRIQMKGCWMNNNECYNKDTCVDNSDARKDNNSFCCCEGHMCNVDVEKQPKQVDDLESDISNTENPVVKYADANSQIFTTLMYSLVPLTGIALIVMVTFWMWRRHKMAYHEALPTQDPSPLPPPSPMLGLRPLQLLEVKARGRFGSVWKAQMINEVVAVKIFPLQDRQSFETEKDIYNLPQLNGHPDILHYIGVETRGDSLNTELWLISEFHERGSLYDYLKGNLISWTDLLHISDCMARGLAFLHEYIPPSKLEGAKPALAHRDFKSKNVLIKYNLCACIADFGLALKFESGRPVGDSHGQVGTRRYMAPEVLEGAINFSRDAFLRIDMYAFGLVLWELVSRCSGVDGPVEDYQLPFEEEIGQHPSLEDMQEVVVQKKIRPHMKELWFKHAGLAAFVETVEECWDHDPEARLSAGCVEERIAQLSQLNASTTSGVVQQPTVQLTSNSQAPPAKESSI